MLTISFLPDFYLDRRLPAWEPFERGGLIRYDLMTQTVNVATGLGEIVAALITKAPESVTQLTPIPVVA